MDVTFDDVEDLENEAWCAEAPAEAPAAEAAAPAEETPAA